MIKKEMEAGEIERRVHDLANAMNKIRSSQADRDDVVVEMKHTKLSRLELLLEDLQSVIDDVPADNEQFDFALSKGEVPRLWVDMTTFVRMGRDGRDYEFVKDTRMGRVILARADNRQKIGAQVTDYVAERVLERERMIEGDWLSLSHMMENHPSNDSTRDKAEDKKVELVEKPQEDENQKTTLETAVNKAQHSSLTLFLWFILGLIGGAGILFILTWFGLMEQIVQMVR